MIIWQFSGIMKLKRAPPVANRTIFRGENPDSPDLLPGLSVLVDAYRTIRLEGAGAVMETQMVAREFRQRMLDGEYLAGTFVKTPAHDVIEVLSRTELDFICLDGEHAPFDWGRMDACLAMAKALQFPALVRVASASTENILHALDSGATGIVVPHVFDVRIAESAARAARFGHHGRGYAGSTRWAEFASRTMPELLERSLNDTTVIVQIEEPEGVEAAADIAAVEGVDGLFIGPADLTVAYGANEEAAEKVRSALSTVGAAARSAGKAYMTFVQNAEQARDWAQHGFTTFFIASEQNLMMGAADAQANGIHILKS